MVQADVRQLLFTPELNVREEDVHVLLEAQAGDRRRIDVQVGAAVIEVKKDLRIGKIRAQAAEQLKGYVERRQQELGQRYVGLLTDGAEWYCYSLQRGDLVEVARHEVNATKPDIDALLVWLEGVLATARNVPPSPEEIRMRLGAASSSHELDRATLTALYLENKDAPAVRTKRRLWARLLETALGTQFQESDDLFVEHTLLVNSAEIIAHAVLGLDIEDTPPVSLLSGAKFEEQGVHGVVEADFFDWVVFLPKGDIFVRTLARRLGRFDWSAVEHDVLKVLYESVIPAETRKKLGEYYTPDWLAQKMVEEVMTKPLEQRVLDPACGSGTFLFHAVRRYLQAADDKKVPLADMLRDVSNRVLGMDLHPVAVTLARVTYLLAIGKKRLRGKRDAIQVPVYLGDSVQWLQKNPTLFSDKELKIVADDERELIATEFNFPNSLLSNARVFDALVQELAAKASAPTRSPGKVPALTAAFKVHAIPLTAQRVITATFETMCRLHDEGRDHIWGYYIRNLARPEWLARPENRADVLIGNPPWLSFRYMPNKRVAGRPSMQETFRDMSEARGLWAGAKVATNQDLSGLFVARAVQLYLKESGRFAFVMPNAVLDRDQFAGFRAGSYDERDAEVRVAFATPWDLRRLRPHFFPRGAAVVFGQRAAQPRAMPPTIEIWSGRLPKVNAPWTVVAGAIERTSATQATFAEEERSEYHARFSQGATIVPRVLFIVNKSDSSPLGQVSGKASIHSVRSANEKMPWKALPPLKGVVETEFLRPVLLGETVLPFRVLKPALAVIPRDTYGLLGTEPEEKGEDRLDHYPGLADWYRRAAQVWNKHRSTERLSLTKQLNFHNKLENQFSIQPQRVVYTASGMHVAAARVENRRAVVGHKLYWATAVSVAEAHYLCAILNSAILTKLVRPLMSYGKDERDIDKHIWKLPIPMFDDEVAMHSEIAALGRQAEEAIAKLAVDRRKHFAAARRAIRELLAESEIGQQIEERVAALLG